MPSSSFQSFAQSVSSFPNASSSIHTYSFSILYFFTKLVVHQCSILFKQILFILAPTKDLPITFVSPTASNIAKIVERIWVSRVEYHGNYGLPIVLLKVLFDVIILLTCRSSVPAFNKVCWLALFVIRCQNAETMGVCFIDSLYSFVGILSWEFHLLVVIHDPEFNSESEFLLRMHHP